MLIEQPDWMDDAACRFSDSELHFPEKGGSTTPAKRVCADCAVREPCLEYALAIDVRHGVWGAMSERERRKLKRARAAGDTVTVRRVLAANAAELEALLDCDRPDGDCDPDVYAEADAALEVGRLSSSKAGELGMCIEGHLVAGDNALRNGSTRDGRPRWRCRICTHDRRNGLADSA